MFSVLLLLLRRVCIVLKLYEIMTFPSFLCHFQDISPCIFLIYTGQFFPEAYRTQNLNHHHHALSKCISEHCKRLCRCENAGSASKDGSFRLYNGLINKSNQLTGILKDKESSDFLILIINTPY